MELATLQSELEENNKNSNIQTSSQAEAEEECCWNDTGRHPLQSSQLL